jgi:hypothetical protein
VGTDPAPVVGNVLESRRGAYSPRRAGRSASSKDAILKCPKCGDEIPPGQEKWHPHPGGQNEKILLPCKKCVEELLSKIRKKDRRRK